MTLQSLITMEVMLVLDLMYGEFVIVGRNIKPKGNFAGSVIVLRKLSKLYEPVDLRAGWMFTTEVFIPAAKMASSEVNSNTTAEAVNSEIINEVRHYEQSVRFSLLWTIKLVAEVKVNWLTEMGTSAKFVTLQLSELRKVWLMRKRLSRVRLTIRSEEYVIFNEVRVLLSLDASNEVLIKLFTYIEVIGKSVRTEVEDLIRTDQQVWTKLSTVPVSIYKFKRYAQPL
ncbi:MAG: hypothetical protein ACTS6G_05870 [Candidatus Hodgkinia cicadicola]